MTKLVLILIVCGIIAVQDTLGKPTAVETALNPLEVVPVEENADVQRDQRSPQFGYGDYDDYGGAGARHFRKHHGHGHGCKKHGCGGHYQKPHYGGGGHYGGQSGSFASASAGSFGSGPHGGSNSQAQSASLSFGPISISTAQAQSSSRGGGYGGYGGYDY